MTRNPFLAAHPGDPVWILDGGLATTLEARGFDMDDPLWSARLLVEAPAAILEAHTDFLHAGADCITTASYQASRAGFANRGLGPDDADALLALSVELATRARDAFWGAWLQMEPASADPGSAPPRRRPLVAASVGPFGAFLADGSEYTGRYPVEGDGLVDFHRERWHHLARAGADLLACETIPSGVEVRVLLALMAETPDTPAWLSLSCRDARHLRDGTPVADVARLCEAVPNLAAVGVNCTGPDAIGPALRELARATTKPLLAYPNAGGTYAVDTRSWSGTPARESWIAHARDWVDLGARAIGGCCRVGPDGVRALRRTLAGPTGDPRRV